MLVYACMRACVRVCECVHAACVHVYVARARVFVCVCARRVVGNVLFVFVFLCISYHTTHTTTAERGAEKQCRRRGANSGQKTKRSIEGEDPAAAGIERFFSLLFFWFGGAWAREHPALAIYYPAALHKLVTHSVGSTRSSRVKGEPLNPISHPVPSACVHYTS